jgi:hypothetical protein
LGLKPISSMLISLHKYINAGKALTLKSKFKNARRA